MSSNSQRAAFEAWTGYSEEAFSRNAGDGYCIKGVDNEWRAYQAALASTEVQALREALQEVVDAADGDGWNVLDASLEKQRAALAAMEKQK